MHGNVLAAALLAAMLALAGCGGGDGHSSHEHAEENTGSRSAAAEAHAGDEHGHEEGEPDFARVAPARAPSLGIAVGEAAAGTVAETVTLTGRLIIDPKRVAAVRARFPGPIVRVHRDVGDHIDRGEPLADVESNESLTVYTVRAPLSGVVLERMTNVGDVAGSDAIFRVGDVSALQAELKAFPSQRAALAVGARARVQLGDTEVDGRVVAIAPQVEGHTQALDVRVSLERPAASTLVPGQFVTGVIERGRGEAAVAVPLDAVQRLDGREVVFVPEPDGFRARPVEIGRRGAVLVEVNRGLAAGERYVTKGAFLLRAEIGKNEAAHEH
jgi:cobalt-zinc-cadmium efflux system membrane fusion protein